MSHRFSFTCDKFLGLNYNHRHGQKLLTGESPDSVNFTVTDSYRLEKRRGYSVLCRLASEGRGIWCGELSGKETAIFVAEAKVYEWCGGESRLIGELESTNGQVDFLRFSDKLYLFDGVKIKVIHNGELLDITPYRPLVAVSTTPDGAGVAFEEKNILTGMMRQSFTMNSTTTLLQLSLTDIDSVDYIKAGEEEILKTKCTIDLKKGTVKLPDSYVSYSVIDGIEIGFTKSDNREKEIHQMCHAVVFGGENDTRIFLWGDGENPDIIRYSGVHSGVSGMEYFPENAFNRIGTKSKISALVRHYDRLIIFCPGEAFYSYMETSADASGREYAIFPVRPLSDSVGGISGAVLVDNFPVTFDKGTLYRWRSTSVRDERYAEDIGERIKEGFVKWNGQDIRLYDSQSSNRLFIFCQNEIYVYDYRLDVFYLWRGFSPCGFGELSSDRVLFQRSDGSLCALFESDTDDSAPVEAVWTSAYLELDEGVKNLYSLDFEVIPEINSRAEVSWISNHGQMGKESFEGNYKRFAFNKLNFTSLGFMTGVSERRIHMRIKHKRFEKMKLKLENSYPDSALHLSSITLKGLVTDKK
jgi:hypothetical protein